MAGRYIINQTAGKRVVILDEDADKVEGGYFNTDGTWVPFGGDNDAVYIGKSFKIKDTTEAAVASSYTYIPAFYTWSGETNARKYGVYFMAYSTKQLKAQFVNQYLSSPPAADTLIDANGDKTNYGETFVCTLPYGLAAEYKDMFDKIFEEVTE